MTKREFFMLWAAKEDIRARAERLKALKSLAAAGAVNGQGVDLNRLAREQKKPIFGICRGFQVLNVAFGGSLYQDIPSQVPGSICHSQSQDLRNVPTHKVTMDENSVLGKILGKEIYTNSFHHQGIKKVGEGLRIVGSTNDGIPEALESEDGLVYAVQWHPEDLYADYPVFKGLFTRLIELASKE